MNRFFVTLLIYLMALGQTWGQSASLLPNAKQQFVNEIGVPFANGTVDFYVPNTNNRKTTWRDPNKGATNTNPVTLDSAGRAVIYGDGSYRQVLKDADGNQIWDALTSSTGTGGGGGGTGGLDGMVVGTILPFSGFVPPTNYDFAYGQTYSRTTYATLFTAITITQLASCTNSSTTVTLSDTSNMGTGMPIEATCLLPGTTISNVANSTQVVVSAAATSTGVVTGTVFPYGNGDGSTTFNLPDLRGRALAGRDNMGTVAANRLTPSYFGNGNVVGTGGGSQSHTLTVVEMPAHSHTAHSVSVVTDPGHTHSLEAAGGPGGGGQTGLEGICTDVNCNHDNYGIAFSRPTDATTQNLLSVNTSSVTGVTVATTTTNDSTGGGSAHSIVQPTITTNYIIKVTGDNGGIGVTSINGMTGAILCGVGLICQNQTIDTQTSGAETLAVKVPAQLVSVSNLSLSGLAAIDGVIPSADYRILAAGQTDPVENGLYLAAAGLWTRVLDWSTSGQVSQGTQVLVTQGNNYQNTNWIVTTSGTIVPGITAVTLINDSAACSSIEKFGGLGDGVADNTTAWNTWKAATINSSQACLTFSAGTYRFNSGVSYLAPTIGARIQVIGLGASVSKLYFPNDNTGMVLDYNTNAESVAHVRNLSFITGGLGTSDGLTIQSAISGGADTLSELTGLTFYGSTGYGQGRFWNRAVRDSGVSNVNMTSLNIWGGGNGCVLSGTPLLCGTAISIEQGSSFANAINIWGINTVYNTYGVHAVNDVEGITISQSNSLADYIGFYATGTIGNGLANYISNSQYNDVAYDIRLTYPNYDFQLTNNFLYVQNANGIAVDMVHYQALNISGGQIICTTNSGTTGIHLDTQDGVFQNNLSNVFIYGCAKAIALGSGTSNISILGMAYANNTVNMEDLGTANTELTIASGLPTFSSSGVTSLNLNVVNRKTNGIAGIELDAQSGSTPKGWVMSARNDTSLQWYSCSGSANCLNAGTYTLGLTLGTNGVLTGVNAAAPSTPSSGQNAFYSDSTAKRFHDKNDAGIIGTTVVADTGASNNFLTAISDTGAISKAQPSFSNLSGVASAAQIAGSAASHAVPVDVAGTPTWKVIPDCQNTAGNHLNYTQSTDAFSCGTSIGNAITALTGDVTASGPGSVAATLTTAQPAVHTWALAQTFTVAPVFTDASGSRTALGLGTAATQNTGTSGANLPFLNGTNTWSGVNNFVAAVNSANYGIIIQNTGTLSFAGLELCSSGGGWLSSARSSGSWQLYSSACGGSYVNPLTYTTTGALSTTLTTTSTGFIATAAAPTVAAAQIGYGSTVVAAGSGTCPTGTVGGQTVAGCIVVNIAGTNKNVPYF